MREMPVGLLQQFDPPAFMPDFDRILGGREAWHKFVSACFGWAIEAQRQKLSNAGTPAPTVQFFDPTVYDPGAVLLQQAVTWNAFPKELIVRFGRNRALVEADRLWPLAAYGDASYDPDNPGQAAKDFQSPGFYRPLDEYCEWHVERDANTNEIRRVTFTSEPPEYWQALFGGTIAIDDGVSASFPGDKMRLVELYRELVSSEVELTDLTVKSPFNGFQVGDYNPYNKWNTTHGIAHLGAPPNSLVAEIRLGADSTILYRNGFGGTVVQADALICCASFGGPDRNSDPTIGATVNALARAGAMITLVNPVGLYIDHIDLTGWEVPDGIAPADCIRILRGRPGMIERLIVEVPKETGRCVGNITIGGVPIKYGGQIAECITVKLVGGAARLGSVANQKLPCVGRCCVDPTYATSLGSGVALSTSTPIGTIDAFAIEGGASELAASLPAIASEPQPLRLFRTRRTVA
jgi:hypothetical protein